MLRIYALRSALTGAEARMWRVTEKYGSFRGVIHSTTTVWSHETCNVGHRSTGRSCQWKHFCDYFCRQSSRWPLHRVQWSRVIWTEIDYWQYIFLAIHSRGSWRVGFFKGLIRTPSYLQSFDQWASSHWLHMSKEYRLTHVVPLRSRSSKPFIDPRNVNSVAPVVLQI